MSFTVLGFLLATAMSTTKATRRAEAPRRSQLIRLIEARREQVAELDRSVRALREQVDDAQEASLRRLRQEDELAATEADLALQAGTVGLRGKGLVVRLSDSQRDASGDEVEEAYRIHDSDIQLVVNALFAAGAEAVAVNDSRIVVTTPIRAAGDTIIVNFRPLIPPYRIHAIAADQRRFERSEIARRFKRWTKLFGLGFAVQEAGQVSVPPYSGRVAITTASPAPGGP